MLYIQNRLSIQLPKQLRTKQLFPQYRRGYRHLGPHQFCIVQFGYQLLGTGSLCLKGFSGQWSLHCLDMQQPEKWGNTAYKEQSSILVPEEFPHPWMESSEVHISGGWLTVSQGPGMANGDLLETAPFIDSLPYLTSPFSYWDHLPNKL